MLASDWRLSTIYRYTTGGYLSITSGGGLDLVRNGTNVGSQPALYVGGDPYGDRSGRPRTNWFNNAAFAQPAVGTFGNVGTRSILGPAFWQFDMALSRSFQIKESQRMEFRVEAYNVPNSFRPDNPNTALNSPQFGILQTSRETRKLQFALKYLF
jgi:hypothetical protein